MLKLFKRKNNKKKSTYLENILKYEFYLYKKGIRYNYNKNLLESSNFFINY